MSNIATDIQMLIDAGVQVIDPARIDIRGSLTFGNNVEIDINVIFKGDVVLGSNINIGPNCIIENATIGNDTIIKENTSITSAIIKENCQIGPYARIRPKTTIGPRSQIGNFVEIKNTTMGYECKINHHSFVGDAQLGNQVIIAAGVITCNFDGTKNHETLIGDHAFIGSGVQLIAPLKIGQEAFIAAGSTITKDVPPKMLALCRVKEMTLKKR